MTGAVALGALGVGVAVLLLELIPGWLERRRYAQAVRMAHSIAQIPGVAGGPDSLHAALRCPTFTDDLAQLADGYKYEDPAMHKLLVASMRGYADLWARTHHVPAEAPRAGSDVARAQTNSPAGAVTSALSPASAGGPARKRIILNDSRPPTHLRLGLR